MKPIDLQPFCARDTDIRRYLRQPFLRNGVVHATNGRILVRVPAWPGCEVAELPAEHLANLDKVMAPMADRQAWGDMPPVPAPKRCPKCRDGRIYGERCESCNGDGEFDHYDHTYHCKACDGDGIFEDPEGTEWIVCHSPKCVGGQLSQPFRIGNSLGDVIYLTLISALPGVQVSVGEDQMAYIYFKFDGGDGALMPIRE